MKCSICNKVLGKNSLKFHEPACQRKRDAIKEREEREAEEERARQAYQIALQEEKEKGELNGKGLR